MSHPTVETVQIRGSALRDCGVEPGGARIRLGLFDAAGVPTDVTLPAECLAQLVMTLPNLAAEALRLRFRDDTLRLVYPLAEWRLEAAQTGARQAGDQLILTLSTADGFAIAFALPPERLSEMAHAARTGTPSPLLPN